MEELVKKVIEWGDEKGIFENSTPEKQFLKTMEEVGELASAINKNDLEEIKDAIGDIAVTLILQMKMQHISISNYNFNHCEPNEFQDFIIAIEKIKNIGVDIANSNQVDSLSIRSSFFYLSSLSMSFGLTLKKCLQSAYDRKVTNV